MHAVLHKGLKFNLVIDRWVCKALTQGQDESIPKRLNSVTFYNKFWWKFVYRLLGWNIQMDRYICFSPVCINFIHFVEKNTKRVCSSKFPSSHLVCCLLHVQGAILTTMLATRNFSSKYDGHGKYLRTPRTKKNGRNSLFVRQSYGIAWSLPFTRNLCFHYLPCLCWIFIQSCVSFLNMLHDTHFGVTTLLLCMIWWLKWSFIMQN